MLTVPPNQPVVYGANLITNGRTPINTASYPIAIAQGGRLQGPPPSTAPNSGVAGQGQLRTKLYVHNICADSLGPWMLLMEAGIPLDLIYLDPTRGETRDPGFLGMNPMGELPVFISTDGTVVWESNTILRYIGEKFPEAHRFYARDVNLRGRIEIALDWCQSTLMPALAKVTYPYLGFSKDKSQINDAKEDLDKNIRVLTDFFLRETPFIGGARPSIADYAVALPLLYLYATDYRTPVKVKEYLETLAARTQSWNEVTEDLKNFMATLK